MWSDSVRLVVFTALELMLPVADAVSAPALMLAAAQVEAAAIVQSQ